MTIEQSLHDKYKDELITLLNSYGFSCIDFEKVQLNTSQKTPDIKENTNDILIEIKVLLPNSDLVAQRNKIDKELEEGISSAFWLEDTGNFGDHLRDSRKKFRAYPGIKTMVIFINLMGYQRQPIEELMAGEEQWTISHTGVNHIGSKNRTVRHDKNTEIGVIAEYCPKEKELVVIHNSFSAQERNIPYDLFPISENIIQKEYRYDNNISTFLKIKR